MARIATIVLTAALPLVALAFWPMYLARPFAAVDRYTHLHAFAGTVWVLLLLAQAAAIHFRRNTLHRRLGATSYIAAPLFVLSAVLLSHHRLVTMDDATFARDGWAHFLPFYASVVFATAWLGGMAFRKIRAAHGRFMLATAIPMVDPVVGRVLAFNLPPLPSFRAYQVITFAIATALAALLVFTYRGDRNARRALYLWFAVLVLLEAGWFTVASTGAWLKVVGWFRAFGLT